MLDAGFKLKKYFFIYFLQTQTVATAPHTVTGKQMGAVAIMTMVVVVSGVYSGGNM